MAKNEDLRFYAVGTAVVVIGVITAGMIGHLLTIEQTEGIGHGVTILDSNQEVTLQNDTAMWTLDVKFSPAHSSCNLVADLSLHSANGTQIGEKKRVLRSVNAGEWFQFTVIDDPSVIDRIANYQLVITNERCPE